MSKQQKGEDYDGGLLDDAPDDLLLACRIENGVLIEEWITRDEAARRHAAHKTK